MSDFHHLYKGLQEADAGGHRAVMATLLATSGSTYRKAGARALFLDDGRSFGMISGGCVDQELRHTAIELEGERQLRTIDTRSAYDIELGYSLGCAGTLTVLLEDLGGPVGTLYHQLLSTPLTAADHTLLYRWNQTSGDPGAACVAGPGWQHPGFTAPADILELAWTAPPRLFVAGAGADTKPLAQLATTLGWNVRLCDHRAALLAEHGAKPAYQVSLCALDSLSQQKPIDRQTAAVVMTHHLPSDHQWLQWLIPQKPRYLGLLGPEARRKALWEFSATRGTPLPPPETLTSLHSPIGLALGGRGPEAIALAIMSQLHQVTCSPQQEVKIPHDERVLQHRHTGSGCESPLRQPQATGLLAQ